MRQTFESTIEFLPIAGQRLQRLDLHSESHHGEYRRMIGQLAREFAHRLADALGLFRRHAA